MHLHCQWLGSLRESKSLRQTGALFIKNGKCIRNTFKVVQGCRAQLRQKYCCAEASSSTVPTQSALLPQNELQAHRIEVESYGRCSAIQCEAARTLCRFVNVQQRAGQA